MILMMVMVTIVAYSSATTPDKWERKDSVHVGAAGPWLAMVKVLAHIHVTKC
jgi:hypothetical protein